MDNVDGVNEMNDEDEVNDVDDVNDVNDMNDVNDVNNIDETDNNNPDLAVSSRAFSKELEFNGFDFCFLDKEKFIAGEILSIMPICKHTFHEKCFKEYSENNSHSCPECFIAI